MDVLASGIKITLKPNTKRGSSTRGLSYNQKLQKKLEPGTPLFGGANEEVEWRLGDVNRFYNSPVNSEYQANRSFYGGEAKRWIGKALEMGYEMDKYGIVRCVSCRFNKCILLHKDLIALWQEILNERNLLKMVSFPKPEPSKDIPAVG